MPAGIQIWDETGRLVLDTTARLGRVMGSVNCGGAPKNTTRNYSWNIPAGVMSQGSPFIWFAFGPVFDQDYYYENANINVNVNGSGKITANLFASDTAIGSFPIYYGVF